MMGIVCGSFYATTVLASLVMVKCFNSEFDDIIIEMGYKIKPMKSNSLVKNIKYFLKTYGTSLIPVYNILSVLIKSMFIDSDTISRKYQNKRIKMLQDTGLLVKTTKKISSPKKVIKKVKLKEVKQLEAPKAKTMPIIRNLDAKTCYERREFLRKEYEKSCRECELESLRAERNFVLSNMGDSMKLTRK